MWCFFTLENENKKYLVKKKQPQKKLPFFKIKNNLNPKKHPHMLFFLTLKNTKILKCSKFNIKKTLAKKHPLIKTTFK